MHWQAAFDSELDGPTVPAAQVLLYEAVAPQLSALRASVDPQALRRPAAAVPSPLHELAAELLAAVARLMSRQPGWVQPRLAPADPVDWATLQARLALAGTTLRRFEQLYRGIVPISGASYWRTPEAVDALSRLLDADEEDEGDDEDE